jgi:hypothetical protein
MQMTLASGGSPGAAEGSAIDAIAHGGKAVFELQHFHAAPVRLHPATIVITATTLEYIPETVCETPAFTVPLASIVSVQIGRKAPDGSHLDLLNIRFKARGADGELSFRDSSSHFGDSSHAAQFSSRLSPGQETAFLAAIRNILLLAEKRRP